MTLEEFYDVMIKIRDFDEFEEIYINGKLSRIDEEGIDRIIFDLGDNYTPQHRDIITNIYQTKLIDNTDWARFTSLIMDDYEFQTLFEIIENHYNLSEDSSDIETWIDILNCLKDMYPEHNKQIVDLKNIIITYSKSSEFEINKFIRKTISKQKSAYMISQISGKTQPIDLHSLKYEESDVFAKVTEIYAKENSYKYLSFDLELVSIEYIVENYLYVLNEISKGNIEEYIFLFTNYKKANDECKRFIKEYTTGAIKTNLKQSTYSLPINNYDYDKNYLEFNSSPSVYLLVLN